MSSVLEERRPLKMDGNGGYFRHPAAILIVHSVLPLMSIFQSVEGATKYKRIITNAVVSLCPPIKVRCDFPSYLVTCAVDFWSPSDCLHQPSPLFPFCRHISQFRQLHSSYFMYLIHPFSPWSSSPPPSISVCQYHSFFQSI